jgi:hypothetical protein
MVSTANLAFILTILIVGWCYLEDPEGTNRLFYIINLKISIQWIRVQQRYLKWKLLRQLNKANRELGLPEISWDKHKIQD